jgi:DNA polymerase-3 subunit epsilon
MSDDSMKGIGGFVLVLLLLGLLVKYWWVAAIIAVIAGVTYFATKYVKSADSTTQQAASRPANTRPGAPSARSASGRSQTSGLRIYDAPEATPPRQPPRGAPGIPQATLTRTPTQYPLTQTTFTAVDLETTGLNPDVDRIVEIGLVKFTADGQIVDEFATLINNPGSCREARDVHQINDVDLVGAPSTIDALREAFTFMAGTVLVAHNFEFEEGFLAAAARRERMVLPPVLGVCTLQTSRRQLDGRAFSLTVMYKTATGEFPTHQHTALGDARSIREILLWLIRNSPSPLHLSVAPPPRVNSAAVAECKISCRPVPLSRSSVAELLAAFPQSPRDRDGDPVEVENYLALLAESVEDGLLTYDEAQALTAQACRTRLTGSQIRELHRQAWQATFPEEKDADAMTLSPVRRREMYLLADALGLTDLAAHLESAIQASAEPAPPVGARYLRGLRIGVIGENGELDVLRKRAESYGAKLAVNMTKTVIWMATTTPDATDSKHNSARNLGVPMLSPVEASVRLDAAIREAELKAYERQRLVDEGQAQRQRYLAEREAYWRPTWRPVELDRDPEYDNWH